MSIAFKFCLKSNNLILKWWESSKNEYFFKFDFQILKVSYNLKVFVWLFSAKKARISLKNLLKSGLKILNVSIYYSKNQKMLCNEFQSNLTL